MSATQAADGILRIAATAMSYAVKGVTTERGLDAGDFALVAYGGAGPLHAVAVAREIGIRNVIIPGAPGVFSAFGMLFSDLRYDYVRTHLMQLADAPFDDIEAVFKELEQQGRDAIAATSVKPHKITVKRAARHALRRPGASGHGRPADARVRRSRTARRSSGISTTMHMLRYGTSAPDERAEIVSLRVTVTGLMKKPPQEKIKTRRGAPPKSAFTGKRPVSFDGKLPRRADLSARGAAGRQQDQRPGADRGARLDHGADAARPHDGRCLRQSGDHGRGSASDGQENMTKTAKKNATRRKVDPVIVEIVRNGVLAVTEEMKTNLMRTAYNMIIYEALDFTTGLFTPEGETVSIGIGLPMFIRGMAETVKAKITHFGIKNMKPGDIYVTNDSYTPAATSIISPSRCRSSTRASSPASPAAWRTGSTSAACSAA